MTSNGLRKEKSLWSLLCLKQHDHMSEYPCQPMSIIKSIISEKMSGPHIKKKKRSNLVWWVIFLLLVSKVYVLIIILEKQGPMIYCRKTNWWWNCNGLHNVLLGDPQGPIIHEEGTISCTIYLIQKTRYIQSENQSSTMVVTFFRRKIYSAWKYSARKYFHKHEVSFTVLS